MKQRHPITTADAETQANALVECEQFRREIGIEPQGYTTADRVAVRVARKYAHRPIDEQEQILRDWFGIKPGKPTPSYISSAIGSAS